MIVCQKCNSSKNVRVHCNMLTAFKQDENGLLSLVDNSIESENIIDGTLEAECRECDTAIKMDEATINGLYSLIK